MTMKNTVLFALATILLFASCNKAFDSSTPGSLSYNLTNGDKSITAGSTLHFNPNLSVSAGDITQTPITISFAGTPAGVTLDNKSVIVNSKTSPTFLFTASATAVPGSYPMQMTVASAGIDPQTYKFNLNVLPTYNCVSDITLNYNYSAYGCNSNYYYVTLDSVPGTPNMFTISNFENFGTNFKLAVLIDCGGSSLPGSVTNIFVPKQTLNGYTISGSGQYYNTTGHTTVSFYDTVVSPTNAKSYCNFQTY